MSSLCDSIGVFGKDAALGQASRIHNQGHYLRVLNRGTRNNSACVGIARLKGTGATVELGVALVMIQGPASVQVRVSSCSQLSAVIMIRKGLGSFKCAKCERHHAASCHHQQSS